MSATVAVEPLHHGPERSFPSQAGGDSGVTRHTVPVRVGRHRAG